MKYILFYKNHKSLPLISGVKYKISSEDANYYLVGKYKIEKSLENKMFYIKEIIL